MYLDLFKHSWRPFACHIILTCTFILFDETQYQTLFTYLFVYFYIYLLQYTYTVFLWDEYASTPPFPSTATRRQ